MEGNLKKCFIIQVTTSLNHTYFPRMEGLERKIILDLVIVFVIYRSCITNYPKSLWLKDSKLFIVFIILGPVDWLA